MRLLLILSSTLLLSACYQAESTLTDSLIYCTDKAPSSFNPQISHDIASIDATTHQLFNRLIKVDPISQRFIGDIASRWEINKAKTDYTFHLRDDVNFHTTTYFKPTRRMNSDDVIFSFKRMLSKTHPFNDINDASKNLLYKQSLAKLLTDIVKIDAYTVRFVLNKPDATLLANLSAHYAVVHSEEYATQLLQAGHPEKIDFFPIGTGPYRFKNRTNNLIRYQQHSRPWQTPAKIKNLIFDITNNNSKRYAKLVSGECDIITNPASSQVKQISHNTDVALSSKLTGNLALIAFNSKKEPLNNLTTRHALSHAIDRNTLIQAVFFGNAVSTDNLLPVHSWAFNPRLAKTDFSPEKSVQLLAENNFDFSQTLRILAPDKESIFNANFYKTAELIQSDLHNIGVKSEIILLRKVALDLALIAGEYDIYLSGQSPYITDPDNFFRPLLSCNASPSEGNSSQWCDTNMQFQLDSTRLELNFIQRIKSYYELQEFIQKKYIYMPIAHLLRFDVFNKNISGIQIDPLTGIDFHKVNKVSPINKDNIR